MLLLVLRVTPSVVVGPVVFLPLVGGFFAVDEPVEFRHGVRRIVFVVARIRLPLVVGVIQFIARSLDILASFST